MYKAPCLFLTRKRDENGLLINFRAVTCACSLKVKQMRLYEISKISFIRIAHNRARSLEEKIVKISKIN